MVYDVIMETQLSNLIWGVHEAQRRLLEVGRFLDELEVELGGLDRRGQYGTNAFRNISADVRDYVEKQKDYFTARDIDFALGLRDKERNSRRQALHRLVAVGYVEKHQTRAACYRWVGRK